MIQLSHLFWMRGHLRISKVPIEKTSQEELLEIELTSSQRMLWTLFVVFQCSKY